MNLQIVTKVYIRVIVPCFPMSLFKYWGCLFQNINPKNLLIYCLLSILLGIFKKNLSFLNWRIVALPYCVGFCHVLTWISHRYIYRLPLEPLSHLPPIITIAEHLIRALCIIQQNFHWLSNFAYGNVYVSVLLSQFIPLSPSPTVSTSLFSMSTSPLLPCRGVHHYHLSRFHTYVLIYNVCFSLSDWLHSV